MRVGFIVALTLSAFLIPALASAQERILFEQRESTQSQSTLVRRAVYLGEGWRNLRLIRFERFIEQGAFVPLPQTGYYFCGEQTFVYVSVIEHMQSDASFEILGVGPDDDLITPGALVDIEDGIRGYVNETDITDLLRGLAPICSARPAREREPEWLFLANTQESVEHLVPNRFIRSGSNVRFWSERRYIRAAQLTQRFRSGTIPDSSLEVLVIDPGRGYVVNQDEANCGANSLRHLQAVTYDREGRVLPASRQEQTTAREVVPNSVGESIVQVVCLIH